MPMGRVSHPPLYKNTAVEISWKAMMKNMTTPTRTPLRSSGSDMLKKVLTFPAPATSDPSLEEASEVSGAGKLRTFFHISLPLLLKGVLVGVVMFFIMAFQEISTAIFLYRGGWETLPIGIFLNWHRGMEFGIAAAMAFLMIVITFILLLIISRIGGGVLKAAWGSGEQ